MIRRLLLATTLAGATVVAGATTAGADPAPPTSLAASDRGFCIAVDGVIGYCQSNPFPGILQIVEDLLP